MLCVCNSMPNNNIKPGNESCFFNLTPMPKRDDRFMARWLIDSMCLQNYKIINHNDGYIDVIKILQMIIDEEIVEKLN